VSNKQELTLIRNAQNLIDAEQNERVRREQLSLSEGRYENLLMSQAEQHAAMRERTRPCATLK
jgi:hypothetical protein